LRARRPRAASRPTPELPDATVHFQAITARAIGLTLPGLSPESAFELRAVEALEEHRAARSGL
jgi:hypothetical protein